MLPIGELTPNPYQPRNTIRAEEILSLAASIKQSGMLQPITARRVSGRYQLIAGERRWRAAQSIGLTEVPVIVRDATDEQMIELALIENLQREDLNAVDRAKAYRQFCDTFNLKPDEVGRRLGEDRTTVVNYLRLLDLADDIQAMIADGRLSMGHARCLLGIADDARRKRLAESVIASDLSVRALEEIVRREKTRPAGIHASAGAVEMPRSAHLGDLERRFEEAVKTKVTIHESKRKGRGRVIIEYFSLDDFDRISSMLGVDLD